MISDRVLVPDCAHCGHGYLRHSMYGACLVRDCEQACTAYTPPAGRTVSELLEQVAEPETGSRLTA